MTAWHRRGSPGADLALAVMQLEAQPVELVADALSAVQDPAEAIERLSFHGAWGHAHRKGSAQGLQFPSWLADEGAGRRAWALENHLRALHDMAELRTVLDAAGVPWLTFKGPTLSVLYGQPDLRGYTDLDVLVSPVDLPAAVTALLDGGWPFIDWQSSLDRRPPMGELHLTGPAGTPVDLHWHLFFRADHPSRSRLDPAALVAARRYTRIGGGLVPTLPLGEHVAYVCAHAAAGGGNRLRWLLDVGHLAARATEHEWRDVVNSSRAWGVPASVSLVLSRASRHIGADVPAWVMATLAGRAPRSLFAVVEMIDPLPRSREHRSATSVLACATDRQATAIARAVLLHRRRRWGLDLRPRREVTSMPGGLRSLNRFVEAVAVEADGRRRNAV